MQAEIQRVAERAAADEAEKCHARAVAEQTAEAMLLATQEELARTQDEVDAVVQAAERRREVRACGWWSTRGGLRVASVAHTTHQQ